MASGNASTLASANAHSDAGDAMTLTASKSYTDTRAASTLTAANAYTDSRLNSLGSDFDQFRGDVNNRFVQTDRRINTVSAMSTAMSQMTANAANGGSKNGRIAVGFGITGGRSSMAIGYGVRAGRVTVSFGAAFGGNKGTLGGGLGLDL